MVMSPMHHTRILQLLNKLQHNIDDVHDNHRVENQHVRMMKVVTPVHGLPRSRWAEFFCFQESTRQNVSRLSTYLPRVILAGISILVGGAPATRPGVNSCVLGSS